MPLEKQTIEIVFGGLAEKADDKMRKPGDLEHAKNVEFDKDGALNKRKGYQWVKTTSNDIYDDAVEDIFHAVGVFGDRLVVFGHDYVYEVPAKSDLTSDRCLKRRGPTLRGMLRSGVVVVGPEASGTYQGQS